MYIRSRRGDYAGLIKAFVEKRDVNVTKWGIIIGHRLFLKCASLLFIPFSPEKKI